MIQDGKYYDIIVNYSEDFIFEFNLNKRINSINKYGENSMHFM